MESTKIPKSFLKPPSKIVKPGTSTSTKPLPSIPEIKISAPTISNGVTKTAAPYKPQPKGLLRRRSKSVSDLRSIQPKPLMSSARVMKTVEKPAPTKAGQKRPALHKNDDENKPKVAKVKIPDWDYKSRFQELQKKHSLVQEEMKQMKSRMSDLTKLGEEVEILRREHEDMKKDLDTCKQSEALVTQERDRLLEENGSLKSSLEKQQETYRLLKESHEILQTENQNNLDKLGDLKQVVQKSNARITELENKNERLEHITQELKRALDDHEELRRSLHNTIQDMKGNIRVFCRIRPAVTLEEKDKLQCSLFYPTEANLEIRKSRESVSTVGGKPMDLRQEFTFDRVFPPVANQVEVFEELSQLVQSALDGYHVCVFAYGQTGSGKTFTMQGSPDDPGMIPRTVDLIFNKIEKLSLSDWTYTVSSSFLEIYNESIRDLLVPNSAYNYELRFNEGRGVTVTNLQTVTIDSAEELKNLMAEAHKNRAVAATDFNEHSSRSHAVTKIHLEGYNKTREVKYCGSINLVDLAGSESAKTSSAERLTETKNINKSLSVLGNVMLALHNKDPHIPYRDSKLTYLLQSCLGGNSKTLMFVNIAPFEECFSESINSLRFASKVKEIKMTARKNKVYSSLPPIPAKT